MFLILDHIRSDECDLSVIRLSDQYQSDICLSVCAIKKLLNEEYVQYCKLKKIFYQWPNNCEASSNPEENFREEADHKYDDDGKGAVDARLFSLV